MNWEMAGRAASYLSALGVFGVLGLRWLLSRAEREDGTEPSVLPQLRALGLVAAASLLAATLLRALCQSLMVWGGAEGLGWEGLTAVAFESRWGARWQWQPLTALVSLVGFTLLRWWPRAGWTMAGLGAVGLAAALPMTGHAYGSATTWISQSVHVLGFGLWLGTLMVAMVASRGRLSPGVDVATVRRRWLGAFAPLASAGAIAVITSGVVLGLASFPSWSSLFSTPYGRVFLGKLTLVAIIGLLGAHNFRVLRNERGAGLDRTAALEATLAILVLLVTAILTSLPQPDMTH